MFKIRTNFSLLLIFSFLVFLLTGSYFGTQYYFFQKEKVYWQNWNHTLKKKNLILTALHEVAHVVINLTIPDYFNSSDQFAIKYKFNKVTIIPDQKQKYYGLTLGKMICHSESNNICNDNQGKKQNTTNFFQLISSVEILKYYLHSVLAGNKILEIFLKNKNTTNLYYHSDFLNYKTVSKDADITKARFLAKIIGQKTGKDVATILKEEYQNLETILTKQKEKILLLSQVLLAKRTLNKKEVALIIKNINNPQNLIAYNLPTQSWDWEIFSPYQKNEIEFWKTFFLFLFFGFVFLFLLLFLVIFFRSPPAKKKS